MNDAFTLQKKTLFLTKYKDQFQPKKKVSLLNITFPNLAISQNQNPPTYLLESFLGKFHWILSLF